MRTFLALLQTNWKIMIQYKHSFFISLLGDPIVLIVTIMNYVAIFAHHSSDKVAGFSLPQMIWYFAGITLVWYCIWNSVDGNISSKILSGDLSQDLLRPFPFILMELAAALSSRLIAFVFEFLPGMVVFSLFFWPRFLTVWSFLKFLVVVGLAFLLYFMINFLIGLASFHLKSNQSLQNLKMALISFTAGAFLPLDFFPFWLRRITDFVPFPYLFYWPIQIFLNTDAALVPGTFLRVVLFQLGWIALFTTVNLVVWKVVLKKFCSVGV
jgi:ABC-2 type transport system permease protein